MSLTPFSFQSMRFTNTIEKQNNYFPLDFLKEDIGPHYQFLRYHSSSFIRSGTSVGSTICIPEVAQVFRIQNRFWIE